MPFKKGISGNPKGLSAEKKRRELQLRELLMKHVPDAVKVIVDCLHDKHNKTWAAKEILDRVYGKAPQSMEIKGEEGADIFKPVLNITIEKK